MTSTAYSSRSAEKFVVRLRGDQRDRLKDMASRQHMSMNSYVTRCIERQLRIDQDLPADSPEFLENKENVSPSSLIPETPCRVKGEIAIFKGATFEKGSSELSAFVMNSEGVIFLVPYSAVEAY